MRHNAAVIELGIGDTALMRCRLEAVRLYFRSGLQTTGKGSRWFYLYRAGRVVEDWDSCPPCMADIFRCMGKAARAALCAVARHLRLQSELCSVFNHLLDDTPLPALDESSSVLVATYSHVSLQNGKGAIGGGKSGVNGEVEKGLLTLISSDISGLQMGGLTSGDLLLITGKALTRATAGLCPTALSRAAFDHLSGTNTGGRTSLAFRLMPQSNAISDCSPISAAGHEISQSHAPISVSQFMDDPSAEEDVLCNQSYNTYVGRNSLHKEHSFRSVLSDPLCGAFLKDAVVVTCGHSFGASCYGEYLKWYTNHNCKLLFASQSKCTLSSQEIDSSSLIPNHVLRAAAAAVKQEDDRRLFHNAALRKHRKEMGEPIDLTRRSNREKGEVAPDGLHRGVQYPFSVNDKLLIKGNRRTPEKFVRKEAIITSQCLNGWYLLKIVETGENIRLQYSSLRKILNSHTIKHRCSSQPIPNNSS